MNICKSCKHWESHENNKPYRAALANLGDCSCPKFVSGYYPNTEPVPVGLDGILVEEDEGWCFYTGPEFGCIHWETK